MLTQARIKSSALGLFRSNSSLNLGFQLTWALLRIVAGVVMVHNGLDKLSNIESFAEAYVAYLGLPFPITLSYIAAYTELIGAPLLALGLFSRFAALGLFSTMLVAMYHHISVAGLSLPYLELSALYAACFFFFLVNGPGLLSADNLIGGVLSNLLEGHSTQRRNSLEVAYQQSGSEDTSPSQTSA